MVSGYKSIISNNNLVFEFRVFHSLGRKALNEIFDIFITLAFANQPESAIQVKVPIPMLGIRAGIFFTCVNLRKAKSFCSMQTVILWHLRLEISSIYPLRSISTKRPLAMNSSKSIKSLT